MVQVESAVDHAIRVAVRRTLLTFQPQMPTIAILMF